MHNVPRTVCHSCRRHQLFQSSLQIRPGSLSSRDILAAADMKLGRFLRDSWRRHNSTARPLRPDKGKSTATEVKRFVDWTKVEIVGGKGGDGRISFLSVYMVENAGPDGGDGGHGGHVFFVADPRVKDLSRVKNTMQAEHGTPGGLRDMHGKNAEPRLIQVPVGTIIRNLEGQIVCDLAKEGTMFLAAKGGAGGKGNAHFKTAVNQAPHVAEIGANGERFKYTLELRTMADVGLIGFPNAGKSTLLQAVSRARPKVAAYPFTTLNPHIGMVFYDDLTQLAVADLPGLVAGASRNHGLGHSFLRHVQRCRLLLYVIDLSDPKPLEQLETLQYELEEYSEGLSRRPAALVANKIDIPHSKNNLQQLQGCGLEILTISGKMGLGVTNLLTRIKTLSDQQSEQDLDRQEEESA